MTKWKEGREHNGLITGRKNHPKCLPKRRVSFTKSEPTPSGEVSARSFSKLMFEGKCGAAIKLLSEEHTHCVLDGDDVIQSGENETTVMEELKLKHPPSQGIDQRALLNPTNLSQVIHPVVFDCIDADLIRSAANRTEGAAGPSGIDAHGWKRMCSAFKAASAELCHSLALLARHLCTSFVHPSGLAPFLACRLIALDKCPGVLPLGVCEVARRIISKTILFVIKSDIQDMTDSSHLCANQIAGMEAAVHSMRSIFDEKETAAILLVDASNAFNSLNRKGSLLNIRQLCPAISTVLINTYRDSTDLFLGGDTILSEEGTTQGDPLATPFYALATRPLIDGLRLSNNSIRQTWYVDDATAAGSISA